MVMFFKRFFITGVKCRERVCLVRDNLAKCHRMAYNGYNFEGNGTTYFTRTLPARIIVFDIIYTNKRRKTHYGSTTTR